MTMVKSEWQPKEPEGRLCYVEHGLAYFTNLPFEGPTAVWGDDWDDAPYEHNAGEPYDGCDAVRFTPGRMSEPYEGFTNSPWSVAQINSGATPWLATCDGGDRIEVKAGATFREFQAALLKAGGTALAPWPSSPAPLTGGRENG